jgi:hypothetical protein
MPPRPAPRPATRPLPPRPAAAPEPPAAPTPPQPSGTGRAILGRLREMATREDEAPDVAKAIRRLLND